MEGRWESVEARPLRGAKGMSKEGRPSMEMRRLSVEVRRPSKDGRSFKFRPARFPRRVFFICACATEPSYMMPLAPLPVE